MPTDADVAKLMERIKALEDAQLELEMEVRASFLAVVAVIERRRKIGKYKPAENPFPRHIIERLTDR